MVERYTNWTDQTDFPDGFAACGVLPRDKVTGKRRRVSRYIEGARSVAEVELSRLRVADNEKRLPTGGTSARSVRAALDLYLEAADTGLIELAPRTILTTRSAANTMCAIALRGGRQFGQSASQGTANVSGIELLAPLAVRCPTPASVGAGSVIVRRRPRPARLRHWRRRDP